MKIAPGTKFRLSLDDRLRARLHQDGWAGSERGGVERMDEKSVTVRLADGQPWHFQRKDFEAACLPDDVQ